MKVKKGSEYLPEYRMVDLEQMRNMLPRGKPRLRVHAAMLRKAGKSCKDIGATLGEKRPCPKIHDNRIVNWPTSARKARRGQKGR